MLPVRTKSVLLVSVFLVGSALLTAYMWTVK